MKKKLLIAGAVIAAFAFGFEANAANIDFSFNGGGISGGGVLSYDETSPDAISGGFPITGFTGNFSDTNAGANILNAAITGVQALNLINPAYGAPFPASMSLFAVTNASPPDVAVSYDNLYYPDGSPITCDGYPFSGGFLDVYGLMFTLDNGFVVDLFSNGNVPDAGPMIYGAVVVDMSASAQNEGAGTIVDYVGGGIGATVPEPGALVLFGLGLAGLGLMRRHRKAA